MKKSNRETPVVFYASMILLAVVLITVHMSSGLYARYITAETASDSARVAAYVFELTNESSNAEMPVTYTSDGSGIYEIQVTNATETRICEVAQSYTITVTNLTNNINFGFDFYITEDCSGDPVTAAGDLPAGIAETDKFYLKISLPENADHSLAGEIDILNISVSAAQKD